MCKITGGCIGKNELMGMLEGVKYLDLILSVVVKNGMKLLDLVSHIALSLLYLIKILWCRPYYWGLRSSFVWF